MQILLCFLPLIFLAILLPFFLTFPFKSQISICNLTQEKQMLLIFPYKTLSPAVIHISANENSTFQIIHPKSTESSLTFLFLSHPTFNSSANCIISTFKLCAKRASSRHLCCYRPDHSVHHYILPRLSKCLLTGLTASVLIL